MTEYQLTSEIETLYYDNFKDRPRSVGEEVKIVIADCLSYFKGAYFSGLEYEYERFIKSIKSFKAESERLDWERKSENVVLLLSIEKDMIVIIAKISKGNLKDPGTLLLFRLHNIIRRFKLSIELTKLRQVTNRLDTKLSLDGVYPHRYLGSFDIEKFIYKILKLYNEKYSDRSEMIEKIKFCVSKYQFMRKDDEAFAYLSDIYNDMLSISEAQNGDQEKATNGDQKKSDTKVTNLLSKLRDQVEGDTRLTMILFELRNLIYRYELDFAMSAVERTSNTYL